jgi:hypothetical protein
MGANARAVGSGLMLGRSSSSRGRHWSVKRALVRPLAQNGTVARVLFVMVVAAGLLVVTAAAPGARNASSTSVIVPIANWLRAEGTSKYPSPGSIAADWTADGNDGLIKGADWVAGDSADTTDPGGEALAFNGTTEFVDIPTADDLTLSRTISVTLDVNFSANPGVQKQVLLQKIGNGTASPYGVRVAPSTSSACNTDTCASIELYWAGQWLNSAPVSWSTATWYTISVEDNGTQVKFSRGGSPTSLSTINSVADPTDGAGTNSSSGSLYLGQGPVGKHRYPFSGDMQNVSLAVPLTVTPNVSDETLGYTTAPVGTPLTVTAQITGAWSNPDDPYLPQPDIYDELHGDPVATEMADPGSVTATLVVTPPGADAVDVPGFLDQNFVDGADGVVPSGPPVWTFRYTPRTAGTFSASVSVTTFNGTTASTSSTDAQSFTVASGLAAGYRGFMELDQTSGNPDRYYVYSQTGTSVFAIGSNLAINELDDASHVSAEQAFFGGSAGTEEMKNGVPTIVGEVPGNGETSKDLGYVYQEYESDLSNLAASGANTGRVRLDSVFLPLELCPAGDWTTSCAPDLQEVYTSKPGVTTHIKGLIGYPNGVMPPNSAVFKSGNRTPAYFGNFAVGRYNDANAWIVDQIVAQALKDGIALQFSAWNTNVDFGDSCYALADVEHACESYYGGQNDQDLVERRLYYDEARWGYSASVLAWEYVNEYPTVHLTSFWTGATVNMNGTPTYVPGVTAWFEAAYNDQQSPNSNAHLITTSCTKSLPGNPICVGPEEVEYHIYSASGIEGSYNRLSQGTWKCIAGEPCIRSEYGIAGDVLPDPNNWVTHKGLWGALAANYSGTWFWWTEQTLNNPGNTPPNPGLRGLPNDFEASWNPWTDTQNSNPYSTFSGIATFDQSWPGDGANSPDGLDSYLWSNANISGPQVTGPDPKNPGLSGEAMIGTSVTDGALNALVWIVNNDSNGGNPASTSDGYPVVPASKVTVSATCSSCARFVAGATYDVQMWDTVTGTAISSLSSTVTASKNGSVVLQIPAIATDIAVTITPA